MYSFVRVPQPDGSKLEKYHMVDKDGEIFGVVVQTARPSLSSHGSLGGNYVYA